LKTAKKILSFLAKEQILSSDIELSKYSTDSSLYEIKPEVVVYPSSAMDIKLLFEYCQLENNYLTFRAAGTSLSGQALTDGILCDISRKFRKLELLDNGEKVRVQPGVRGGYINKLLAKQGRILGPDPASIENCMIGGIVANNSSGMSSGIHSNPFQTLDSIKLVFPSGLMLDTSSEKSRANFSENAKELIDEIVAIREEVRSNEKVLARINEKYKIKNTIGYAMNAFTEADDPIDIIEKLIVGSEGTLAFIEEATLRTIRSYPEKYTGYLCFASPEEACKAIQPFKTAGAKVIEIIDYNCMKSVAHNDFLKNVFPALPDNAASILFEFQEDNPDYIKQKIEATEEIIKKLTLVADPLIAESNEVRNQIWDIRKGLLASIGGSLNAGETVIIEDVAFRLEDLPTAINDLNELFRKFEYSKSGVYGHGIDGNLHFLISQDFSIGSEKKKFAAFLEDLYKLVVLKYNGSLKAEHGTGRNMAPYVEKEWGTDIYNLMKRIKKAFDPENILNPGVLINDDPNVHIANLKKTPGYGEAFDSCIECGFCERVCPSRDLSFTPRQRIKMLRNIKNDIKSNQNKELLYNLVDTCAVDGLCQTACPVSINTGEIVKNLRNQLLSKSEKTIAKVISNNFAVAETTAKAGLSIGHAIEAISWPNTTLQLGHVAENMMRTTLPKWNQYLPKVSHYQTIKHIRPDFVYFPCCISRIMGQPADTNEKNLIDTIASISEKAGFKLLISDEANSQCCGNAFLSKGYFAAYRNSLSKLINTLYEWTNGGRIPVVFDSSSCTHSFRDATEYVDEYDIEQYDKLTILDIVEFLHDEALPNLEIKRTTESIALHPNCSIRKMNLENKMVSIAKVFSENVSVPDNLDCCGFAGDRGMLYPELTDLATMAEGKEVIALEADLHYSSNIPCEVGMTAASKENYQSIAYLVDKNSV
jgi:D-lactate dehydrogenase